MDVLTRGNERLDSVAVHILTGSGVFSRHEMVSMGSGGRGTYQALIPSLLQRDARFYISAADSTGTARFVSPIGAPARLYAFEGRGDSSVVVLGGGIPDSFTMEQNYPIRSTRRPPFRFNFAENRHFHENRRFERKIHTHPVQGIRRTRKAESGMDGRDDDGRRVATGIYLCVIESGASVTVRKMTCLR